MSDSELSSHFFFLGGGCPISHRLVYLGVLHGAPEGEGQHHQPWPCLQYILMARGTTGAGDAMALLLFCQIERVHWQLSIIATIMKDDIVTVTRATFRGGWGAFAQAPLGDMLPPPPPPPPCRSTASLSLYLSIYTN